LTHSELKLGSASAKSSSSTPIAIEAENELERTKVGVGRRSDGVVVKLVDMRVTPASGSLGAFVSDVNLTVPLNPADLAELQQALADHLVVFVRDQPMSLDALEQLTDQLGGRDVTPYVKPLDDRPFVIRVVKEAHDELNFANAWHTDLSYLPEPPSYTLLHAWDVPVAGGDTLWCNQYLAFQQLSVGLRHTLMGLSAVHSAGLAYGTGGYLEKVASKSSMAIEPSADAYRTQVHPLVTQHPVTGKPALYVNPVYTQTIDGWNPVESAALLTHLYRVSTGENLTCRLHWEPQTLAIWDNRCTMHNALNDYSGVRREMFRTSVKGSQPRAVGA
jgi:taurine dioxygenase